MAATSFHAEMMAALDAQVKSGRALANSVPPAQYYPMRRALRKAQMRGYPIRDAQELAAATLAELGR